MNMRGGRGVRTTGLGGTTGGTARPGTRYFDRPRARAGFPRQSAVVFLLLALLACGSPPAFSAEERDAAGEAKVRDFAFTTLSGETFRLETLTGRGTPVLVNFWGLRCDACIQELPLLNDIWKRYRDRVSVFGVNTDGVDGDTLAQMTRELEIRIDFPIVPDPNFVLVDGFKLNAAPLTIIVGPGRDVLYRHEGYEPGQEKTIEEILKTALKPRETR